MSQTEPWISFHAPWTSRAKSGLLVLEQIERFLAAVAVDPAPDGAELTVHAAPADRSLLDEAARRFGPGEHRHGPDLARGQWERRTRPVELAPLLDFYRAHESLPPVDGRRPVDVTVTYWFELKQIASATLRSSVMVWLGTKHVNLSVRYDAPDFTPALRAIHAEIVAALGPKTPRHALQRIIPATRPGGRERRVPLTA